MLCACGGRSNPTGASYLLPLLHVDPALREDGAQTHRSRSIHTCLKHRLNGCQPHAERSHNGDLNPPQSLCLTFADLHFLWGSAPPPHCVTHGPGLSLCLCSPPPLPSCLGRPAPAGRGSPLWMLVAWPDVPATAGLSVPTEVLCANLEHLLTMPRGKKPDLRQELGATQPTRVAGNCSTEGREGLQGGPVWPEDSAGKCLERQSCRAEDHSRHHSSLASPLQVCSPRSAAQPGCVTTTLVPPWPSLSDPAMLRTLGTCTLARRQTTTAVLAPPTESSCFSKR